MHPEFNTLTATAGLEIIDPIETRRFTFRTPDPVEPVPADTDRFAFPVDTACEIRASTLTLPHTVPVDIRTPDGDHVASLSSPERREFDEEAYLLDLHAPIKLYLLVSGPVTVEAAAEQVTFEFGDETTVRVGARSYHSSPAGTITVPDDPEALMDAVTAFSSALKTTSPERAWPTLRGHPPRIKRGDELDIPDGIDPPDTGITIEVPAEYGPVYAVAPLAYYLGADVVPGETARLRTDTGVERCLGDDTSAVVESVETILKRVFLLDCVVRTEGYHPVELHERQQLESHVDLDFADLYDASLVERLTVYLSVPDEAIASIMPTWHRVTHVQPDASSVELLPYVVNDLSIVHIESVAEGSWTATEDQRETEDALGSFLRRATPTGGPTMQSSTEGLVRSASRQAPGVRSPPDDDRETVGSKRGIPGAGEYIPLPEVDAQEQAYVGDKTPERGAKLLAEAFENDTPENTKGAIEITVVCNDDQMREEWDALSEIYGDRDGVNVDADFRFGVSTDDLRELLAENHDVLHFIGHIDGLGFECPDGILDAKTVEETGVTTLLLNGCRSYDQGIALIEAGANAAVVSLGDVGNEGAIEVGKTLARLLHHGFSIGSAMEIVRVYTSIGRDYLVVGDPGVNVAQSESGVPAMYHITDESLEGDELEVEPYTYPALGFGVGALYQSFLPDIDVFSIGIGESKKSTISRDAVRSVLAENPEPLIVDGELIWSSVWFERF